MTVPTAQFRVLSRLRRGFAAAPWTSLIEAAARLGYLARGAVYISIGAIAVLAALHMTPHAVGAVEALTAWGQWPPGVILLWLLGGGLYGFAGWRALQALFDADHQGRKPRALASRAGQAISGLVYGGLAISVFGILDTLEDLHEADDQAATTAAIQAALELPYGPLLVIGAGGFIVACGAGNVLRAIFDHFARTLDCGPAFARWAGPLARAGYFARGVALLPAGVFMIRSGLHARAHEARGLGGALDELHRQPLGGVVLGLTALGLIAFGAFAILEAAFRPIRAQAALHGD